MPWLLLRYSRDLILLCPLLGDGRSTQSIAQGKETSDMSFTVNQHHFDVFTDLAHQTGAPASRKPYSWAKGIVADQKSITMLPNEQVSRDFLKSICADSSVSDENCFLAIMAWGGMKKNLLRE